VRAVTGGFDFLRDTVPDSIESLLDWRLPRRMRGVASAALTVTIAAVVALGIECTRVNDALARQASAVAAFERSRESLAAARISYGNVERLLAVDRSLARARTSGLRLATFMAHIGNAIPRGAWLEGVEPADDGVMQLHGEATSLDAVEQVLTQLARSDQNQRARLVSLRRRGRSGLAPIVAFELRLESSR
jgi:hypothetical protein